MAGTINKKIIPDIGDMVENTHTDEAGNTRKYTGLVIAKAYGTVDVKWVHCNKDTLGFPFPVVENIRERYFRDEAHDLIDLSFVEHNKLRVIS